MDLLEGVFAASQTSANGADTPKRGMSVNLITKSGGNALHGAAESAFTNHDFESDNINAKLRAQGVKSAPALGDQRWRWAKSKLA